MIFKTPRVLKICVIGAGSHSRLFHLPALARYQANFPGQVSITAICDWDQTKANAAAKEFKVPNAYSNLDEMLVKENPDACLAITSIESNAAVAIRLLRDGIPVLMEKPIGASLAEALEVVSVAAETKGRIMVSMNRRFTPSLRQALVWLDGRRPSYIRATMARHNRPEAVFLEETGLHLIDVILMVAGETASWTTRTETVSGVQWRQIRLEFTQGGYGLVDILPTTGGNAEFLEIFGEGFRIEIRGGEFDDSGWRAWIDGKLVRDDSIAPKMPIDIANGTYDETAAFLEGLQQGSPLSPSPADVLEAIELCHAIAAVTAAT